ncbi:hypothetical protein ACO2Q1_11645 [Brevundimonas sp. VNH65]|uniref:hypothetical protein n=1 Tax=Brevundimonas sp. VNH65 TaxID=3400917 RepID=UPI003C0D4EA8
MDHDHRPTTQTEAVSYTALLDQCWVILLWDPDGNDTSPWSVKAETKDEAIQKAVADWHRWLVEENAVFMPHPPPDVFKVYRNSWIGERVSHTD